MTKLQYVPSSIRRTLLICTGLASLLAILLLPGHSSASSQSFSLLNGKPTSGMIVSLTSTPGVIEPANDKNSKSLVGVIVSGDSSSEQQAGQVIVNTDGASNALMSTLNGDIKVGDRITSSPLEGVGTKSNANNWIVGVAQASLDSSTKGAVKSTVTDSKDVKHTIYVANLPILVKVTYYNSDVASSNSGVPEGVQQAVDNIAGKHVSPTALLLSFLLFVVGVVVAGVVINSSTRGGLQAISRQPLSKKAVLRQVWRSIGVAILILLFVLVAVFLMLRII